MAESDPPNSVDPEAVEAVAKRAEGDAEKLRGRGLVEAGRLERLRDRLALHLVEEVVKREAPGAEGAVERGDPILERPLCEVEISLGDRLLAAQRERALEDVLQLAHVAGKIV